MFKVMARQDRQAKTRTFEVNAAGIVLWDRLNPGSTIPRAAPYRRIDGVWIGP
jgi:hypothetical protein